MKTEDPSKGVDRSARALSPFIADEGETRRRARHGLSIFLTIVVLLTAVFQAAIISTDLIELSLGLMWVPAIASIVARLVLREGFADVSFRFGGRRGRNAILLALVLPTLIGFIAYGGAWTTGLAQFALPPAPGLIAQLVGEDASPLAVFLVGLALSSTLFSAVSCIFAAGEEIGWRGYMLTRLIDAGVPRPVLVSGLIWSLWHMPVVLAGMYAAGPSPTLSAILLMVMVTSSGYVMARMRLETGSVWPAIVLHAAWNSIIQGPFDGVTTGAGATLWVGESGILTALTYVVVAVIFSRGQWTILHRPVKGGKK